MAGVRATAAEESMVAAEKVRVAVVMVVAKGEVATVVVVMAVVAKEVTMARVEEAKEKAEVEKVTVVEGVAEAGLVVEVQAAEALIEYPGSGQMPRSGTDAQSSVADGDSGGGVEFARMDDLLSGKGLETQSWLSGLPGLRGGTASGEDALGSPMPGVVTSPAAAGEGRDREMDRAAHRPLTDILMHPFLSSAAGHARWAAANSAAPSLRNLVVCQTRSPRS